MSGETGDQLPTRRETDQEQGYDEIAADRLRGYEGWIKSLFETVKDNGITEDQAQKEIAVAMATLALQRDISEEDARHANEKAKRDTLTGLYNRAYMNEILQRMKTENIPFAAVMVDIDNFRMFNDEHGHRAGDVALVETALSLTGKMRGGDVLIRYGGEEILVLLPRVTNPARVNEVGKGMVEVMRSRKIDVDGKQLGITISAGGSISLPDEDPLDTVGRADDALYVAKDNGRNQMTLCPS